MQFTGDLYVNESSRDSPQLEEKTTLVCHMLEHVGCENEIKTPVFVRDCPSIVTLNVNVLRPQMLGTLRSYFYTGPLLSNFFRREFLKNGPCTAAHVQNVLDRRPDSSDHPFNVAGFFDGANRPPLHHLVIVFSG